MAAPPPCSPHLSFQPHPPARCFLGSACLLSSQLASGTTLFRCPGTTRLQPLMSPSLPSPGPVPPALPSQSPRTSVGPGGACIGEQVDPLLGVQGPGVSRAGKWTRWTGERAWSSRRGSGSYTEKASCEGLHGAQARGAGSVWFREGPRASPAELAPSRCLGLSGSRPTPEPELAYPVPIWSLWAVPIVGSERGSVLPCPPNTLFWVLPVLMLFSRSLFPEEVGRQ